jgi:uncharacterized RDD family membrane protein YckC
MAEEAMSPFAPPKANLEGAAATAGSLALAERGTRLAAVLLDGLVSIPGVLLFMIPAVMMRGDPGKGGMFLPMALGGLYFLAFAIYQIYLLSTRGQTLGKKWMKIRIIKLDGANPGFVGAVLLRAIVNGIISAIPYLGGIYGLVDILFIFREDRRCIHDMIAGTRVVKAT